MTDYLAAAEQLAETLRADAADRDRANQRPLWEVESVRESGLLAAPPDDHVTTHAVTRVVAAADASVGHILGYHYLHLWRFGLFENPEAVTRIWRETASEHLLWAGVSNPGDVLAATPDGAGLRIDGRRVFATGAAVADRLIVNATRGDTGERLTLDVPATSPGITHPPDWDNIGQRLSASGSVVFDGVRVTPEQVIGVLPPADDDPRWVRLSLSALGYQSVLTQVCVALAEGALTEAAEYTRRFSRPWPLSGVDKAEQDPHVLAGYGEVVADVQAAGLLADHAVRAFQDADGRGADLTARQRGEAGVAISAAKVVATRVANHTTAKVFEFTGARSTGAGYGFDRFWRNARTLTLHDPVAYKAREVGAHFLSGDLPPYTAYS